MTGNRARAIASRSLTWGIILVSVGALFALMGAGLQAWFPALIGGPAAAIVHLLLTITGIGTPLFVPLGAVLIGAAIVIRALAPERHEAGGMHQ